MKEEKKRIEWIDFARGAGIFLVFIGHTNIAYLPEFFCYAFHIPFFFILSGICFNVKEGESFKSFLVKKIKTLVVPYFFLSALIFISDCIIEYIFGELTKEFVISDFINFLLQRHHKTVWFLACLFICEILAYCAVKAFKNKKVYYYVTIILFFAGAYFYFKFVNVYLLWAGDIVLTAFPFFLIGYAFKDLLMDIKIKFKPIVMSVLMLLSIVVNYLNIRVVSDIAKVNMYFNEYGNYALFVLSSLLGSVAFIGFAQMIKSNEIVNYIGRNSLVFFTLHQSVYYLHYVLVNKLYIEGAGGRQCAGLFS